MGWLPKEQSFSFEHQPIEGLFLLDGDVIAEEVGRDYTRGDKYPRIAFPSGLKFDLWEGKDTPIVHLFGELDLSLRDTRDEAFKQAFDIGEQCGYLAAPMGDNQLELIGWEDHLLVTYDNERRVMVDVEVVKREQPDRSPATDHAPQTEPLFEIGQVVATPGALEALKAAGQDPAELLSRHVTGDFGDIPDEDRQENELSIEKGFRIMSAYTLSTDEKVWLITEADRSSSTFLLPEEY